MSFFKLSQHLALLSLRCVLWLILLISTKSAKAQTDSLINLFNQSKSPNERAVYAVEIGRAFVSSNPSLSVIYLKEAIGDSTRITDKLSLAKCLKVLGVTYYYKGLYDSSMLAYRQAIKIFAELRDSVQVNSTLKNKALSLSGKGSYAEAISVYLETLQFFREVKDTAQLVGTLNDIGNTYLRLKNFTEGLKFQYEALAYLAHYNQPAMKGNVLNSIGYCYDVGQINNDSAIYYYTESLRLKEKYGNVYSQINTKSNLCSCYDLDTRMPELITCFEELLVLQQKVQDNTGIARSYINLSNARNRLKQYDQALLYLREAVKYAEMTADDYLKAEAFKKLAEIHSFRKEFAPAFAALTKHLVLKDSIYSIEQNKLTVEMAARYELEKKNRDIAETNARLNESENERLRGELVLRNRNAWIIALILTLLLGVSVAVVINQRLKHTKEKEMAEAVLAERDKGIKAIIDAQEDERTRIARDLHDGIGNNLLALQMELKNLRTTGTLLDPVDSVVQNLSGVMNEVRSVSHQMMPKVLQEFGCVPAIRDMLEKVLGSASIHYSFDVHIAEGKRYAARIETAVYRITQELINNIIRHSGASDVTVQVIERGQTLILFVEDNGKGMDKSEPGGLGMSSIKSRLGAVNGELNIHTGETGGTVASIRIPLI